MAEGAEPSRAKRGQAKPTADQAGCTFRTPQGSDDSLASCEANGAAHQQQRCAKTDQSCDWSNGLQMKPERVAPNRSVLATVDCMWYRIEPPRTHDGAQHEATSQTGK